MDESNPFSIAGKMFGAIATIARNAPIYPVNHPLVTEATAEVAKMVKECCDGSSQLSFHIIKSELYFNTQLLPEETIKHADFIRYLVGKGISNFSLKSDVTPEAIASFFALIGKDRSGALSRQALKKWLRDANIVGIEFNTLVGVDLTENVYELVKKESTSPAVQSYHGAVERLEVLGDDISHASNIDNNGLQETVSSLIGDFIGDRHSVLGIMSIKNYDQHLFHHSVNVAVTSLLIARKLSFTEEQMRLVCLSGLLHDLGKLKVPREIITKPDKLSEAEWSIIRRHPIEGALMLMRHDNISELAVLAALEHHAGYDLSGYPTLRGKAHPHIIARIIGIADVYEAMTANRTYRPAQTVDTAIKALLNGSGGQFDPLLVKLLLGITGVFPPGSIVRLNNGATALVVEPNEDNPFFPKVKILEGSPHTPTDGPPINTADDPSRYAVAGVADSDDI